MTENCCPLLVDAEGTPKTIRLIKRGVFEYRRIAGGGEHSTLYRFDAQKTITRTAAGMVWRDRRGNDLVKVTDVRGEDWQYQYQTLKGVRVMQSKTRPEGVVTALEHVILKGGIKCIPTQRESGVGAISVTQDATG